MKLPRRFDAILKKKEEFLTSARARLENTALRLQVSLFEEIITDIIPRLDVKGGQILETANNYRLISELDKLYDSFNVKIVNTILPQINKGTELLAGLTEGYFALSVETGKKFERIIQGAKELTDLKIGLRAGKMIRGGNIMSSLTVDPTEFKQLLSRAVTSGMGTKELIGVVKDNINGTIGEKVRSGVVDRQLNRFAYDTFQQFDRSYNKKLAEEFEFDYFIYQGGLIPDSRDFCVAHNGKVWSREETETWAQWTPAQGEYPDAYEIKAKNVNQVPSYLDQPGYDPLVDLGGYNCRHIMGFIPDDLAFKLRPDLKENL